MKTMMVKSLVVGTGCGTPLWWRGGKGEVVNMGSDMLDSSWLMWLDILEG